jgi:hypothetical protein
MGNCSGLQGSLDDCDFEGGTNIAILVD